MANKNIPLFKVFMSESVDSEVLEVLHSGFIGEGPKVVEFEKALAEYIGNDKVNTLHSGTAGLHLAYHISINHATNAEIITTPITCTATNTPILANNAKIVWADVDPISGNIDPNDIERKITKNTKAIVMVHWGGNPCDISRINEIAKANNIKVVEDGAHAMGTLYENKPLGNHSDFTMYSLQAIKHITSIDGGVLVSNSKEDHERARLLRWYGISREVREAKDLRCEIDVAEAGYKFHMNDVCATVGLENFKHLNWITERHRSNAKFYENAFKDVEGITVVPETTNSKSSYWLFTLHLQNRDHVMNSLKEYGIMTSKVHARNDTHSMFKEFYDPNLPNALKFNDTHLCIPVGWWVSDDDREYIAEKLIKCSR